MRRHFIHVFCFIERHLLLKITSWPAKHARWPVRDRITGSLNAFGWASSRLDLNACSDISRNHSASPVQGHAKKLPRNSLLIACRSQPLIRIPLHARESPINYGRSETCQTRKLSIVQHIPTEGEAYGRHLRGRVVRRLNRGAIPASRTHWHPLSVVRESAVSAEVRREVDV